MWKMCAWVYFHFLVVEIGGDESKGDVSFVGGGFETKKKKKKKKMRIKEEE